MAEYKHDVFISYRHDSPEHESSALLARTICESLRSKPYCFDVFLDTDNLKGGRYDPQLFKAISDSRRFICVLPPDGLNNCWNEEDWIRKEVAYAISTKKRIIPVFMDGFDKNNIKNISLPPDMSGFFDRELIDGVNAENYNSKFEKIIRLLNLQSKASLIKKRLLLIAAGVFLAALFVVMMITHNNDEKSDTFKSEENHTVASAISHSDITDTVVQSESSYTQVLKQHLNDSEEIEQSLYYDYDNDGNYEMFSLVCLKSNRLQQSLWFTNFKECNKINEFDPTIPHADIEILSDGISSVLCLYHPGSANWGPINGDIANHSYIYGVNDNIPVETTFSAFLTLTQSKKCNSLIVGIGPGFIHNRKVYYFYISQGKLKEYGFVPCKETFVKEFDNGDEVMQSLIDKEKCISITGYYRSNKIISINVEKMIMDEITQKEKIAKMSYKYYISNNKLLFLGDEGTALEGIYYCLDDKNAIFPNI